MTRPWRFLLVLSTLVPLQSLAWAQGDTTPPVFLSAPIVSPNSNPAAPLTARLQITSNEPVIVEVGAREVTRTWRFTPTADFATTHDVPLIGFRPDRPHRLTIALRDAAGNRAVWPLGIVFTTPPLPANFPPLTVPTSLPDQMEPGITVASMFFSSPTISGTGSYMVHFDQTGQVVWLYESATSLRDVTRMRNGNLLTWSDNRYVQEIDLFGNILTTWWAARLGTTGAPAGAVMVDCDSFHHEIAELPEAEQADFIALSTEMRVLPNYPTSEVDTTQTSPTGNVVGDVVIEFNRDGTLVREFKIMDVLDAYRICYGSLANFYNQLYSLNTLDWSHGNSVVIDPSDDTWIISLRHQDAVVKVRRSDHQIIWIHGAHERWLPRWQPFLLTQVGSPFEWQFHQHSSDLDGAGNMILFDNGNYRVIPPTAPPPVSQWYSRAVKFLVDPVAMTTQQVWNYDGGGVPFFDGFLCDADPLPNGNVLVTEGSRLVPGMNKTYSRLFEVRDTFAGQQVVWDVIVNDPASANPNPYNWNVYRSERYPGLYVD